MAIYNGGLNIIAPDISGKEDKSNKVTAWSSTTTDVHYPSEKLVKDALDGKAEKSEIEASVTTNSLTAGAILPKGSANIGAEKSWFNNVYANTLYSDTLYVNNFSLQSKIASQKSLSYIDKQGGRSVYLKAISLTFTSNYNNACMTWAVTQRQYASYYIDLFLVNRSDSKVDIDYFGIRPKYRNDSSALVYAVVSGSTLDIYIKKIEDYDTISIINCEYSDKYLGVNITYNDGNEYVTSLPSGAIQAKCPAYIASEGLYGAVFN